MCAGANLQQSSATIIGFLVAVKATGGVALVVTCSDVRGARQLRKHPAARHLATIGSRCSLMLGIKLLKLRV